MTDQASNVINFDRAHTPWDSCSETERACIEEFQAEIGLDRESARVLWFYRAGAWNRLWQHEKRFAEALEAKLAAAAAERAIVNGNGRDESGIDWDRFDRGRNRRELPTQAPAPQQPSLPPLSFVNMSSWDSEPIPDPDWTVLNRIPRRQCVLFSGEGAAGKSTLQLQLCAAHALPAGRDWLGTLPAPGRALFVDAEDDESVMHRRLAAVGKHYGTTFADLIWGGLHLLSWVGQDAVLATSTRSGKIEPTARYEQLRQAVGDIKPVMIGLASSANLYAGSEIDRAQVQQFVSLLTRLAILSNGSVVLLSHPSLTGINTGTGLSGNTQWHNAVRARFYLKSVKPEDGEQADNDLREVVFLKNNYGSRAESVVLRYRDGLFLPLPGVASLDRAAAELRADGVFLDLLRRFTKENRTVGDRRGTSYAPALFAREDEATRAGITGKALTAAMRRLFAAGRIWNEPYGRPSRQSFRLAIKD